MAQITTEHDYKLPTAMVSEKQIKEKAPDAIRYLERKGATDLLEVLGLKEEA